MEAEVREKQAEDLKYMKEKEVEFEDMVKEYTVVQREFEEAKGEYERELHEIKQEHKCELLEKELQQIRMQKEMQEGRTLLQMESVKKENEYKQIFEHFLSEQSAERLLQQNNVSLHSMHWINGLHALFGKQVSKHVVFELVIVCGQLFIRTVMATLTNLCCNIFNQIIAISLLHFSDTPNWGTSSCWGEIVTGWSEGAQEC